MAKYIRRETITFRSSDSKNEYNLKGRIMQDGKFDMISYSVMIPDNLIKLVKKGCLDGPGTKIGTYDSQNIIHDWDRIPTVVSIGNALEEVIILINEIIANEHIDLIKIVTFSCLSDRVLRWLYRVEGAQQIGDSSVEVPNIKMLVTKFIISTFGCDRYLKVLYRLKALGDGDDDRINYVESFAASN